MLVCLLCNIEKDENSFAKSELNLRKRCKFCRKNQAKCYYLNNLLWKMKNLKNAGH